MREAVIDGETGFVVPENDDVLLADRLKSLIEDADLRSAMGQAARDHYEEHFVFDRLKRESLQLYESVLREDRA